MCINSNVFSTKWMCPQRTPVRSYLAFLLPAPSPLCSAGDAARSLRFEPTADSSAAFELLVVVAVLVLDVVVVVVAALWGPVCVVMPAMPLLLLLPLPLLLELVLLSAERENCSSASADGVDMLALLL